jgi:hypothetical protein
MIDFVNIYNYHQDKKVSSLIKVNISSNIYDVYLSKAGALGSARGNLRRHLHEYLDNKWSLDL